MHTPPDPCDVVPTTPTRSIDYYPLNPTTTKPENGGAELKKRNIRFNQNDQNAVENEKGKRRLSTSGSVVMTYTEQQRRNKKQNKASAKFKENVELALRVALGVCIAGAIQTKKKYFFSNPSTDGNGDEFVFLPNYYNLNVFTYTASGVLFSAGRNIGESFNLAFQSVTGVIIAMLSSVLYYATLTRFHTGGTYQALSLVGPSYPVDPVACYTGLTFFIVYTFLIFSSPLKSTTKKFAVSVSAFFILNLINPKRYSVEGELHRTVVSCGIYGLIGVVGCFITLFTLCFPYPRIAIQQLRVLLKETHSDSILLFNTIVDSYCYRKKSNLDLDFYSLRIEQLSQVLQDHIAKLEQLIDNVWWEQVLGLHLILKFNPSIAKQYIRLLRKFLDQCSSLQRAVSEEKYDQVHVFLISNIQKKFYQVQVNIVSVLGEITSEIQQGKRVLELKKLNTLKLSVDEMIVFYRRSQNRIFRSQSMSTAQWERNGALNLFLFIMVSIADSLEEFQTGFNHKHFDMRYRVKSFIRRSLMSFFLKKNYSFDVVKSSFKVTFAIIPAFIFAVYFFGYDSNAPAGIAVVMGNHLGGSFRTTAHRVAGVTIGSIIPSLFKFFLCRICTNGVPMTIITNVATNIVLFVFVSLSMFVNFNGGDFSYCGVVAAFVGQNILLTSCATGSCNGTSSPINYNSLSQTSIGMLLFILVEVFLFPSSTYTLLRRKIQKIWRTQVEIYSMLSDQISLVKEDEKTAKARAHLASVISTDLHLLLNDQDHLLIEASLEPDLWRPPLPYTMLLSVTKINRSLYDNLLLLHGLLQWRAGRLWDPEKSGLAFTPKEAIPTFFQVSKVVIGNYETVIEVFNDVYLLSDNHDAAFYIKMRTAFRDADQDGSGTVDMSELTVILEKILNKRFSGEVLDQYVKEFMQIADTDNNGQIELEEFMRAVEGISFEVTSEEKPSNSTSVSIDDSTYGMTIRYGMLDECSVCLTELVQIMNEDWVANEELIMKCCTEDILVMNCFISTVTKIAKDLVKLEKIISST